MKNIFKDYAPKYFEKGLYVIPLRYKIPVIKNWSMFSKTAPSELLFDSWLTKYPSHNIGLLTGKLSGIIAIDIDKESALKLVPPSPVAKKGKKGETRFFRYNGEVNFKRHDIGVELLSDGNQTVICPSIHPETKEPYTWTSIETLLSFDVEDLPVLDEKFFNDVGAIEIMKTETSGRHNKLVEIASAMIARGEELTMIVKEIQDYDNQNHEPPYFTDSSEPHKGKGYLAAVKMVTSLMETIERKGGNIEPIRVEFVQPEKDIQEVIDKSKKIIDIEYPEPSGYLKKIQDEVLRRSRKPRSKFALASALASVGVITSNKIRFQDSTPNLYQMIVAESGEGKDVPLKFPKKVLIENGLLEYIGLESYRGDKSIVKKFEAQRERIDTIDEVSKLFRSINSTNLFSSNIAEVLTELWNSSSELFTGFTTSQETTGMTYCPCLTLFGATTPDAFSNTFQSKNLMQGFGSRFIYVFDEKRVELVEPSFEEMSDDLKDFFYFWGSMDIKVEKVDISKTSSVSIDLSQAKPSVTMLKEIDKPCPVELPMTQDAKDYMIKSMHYFDELSYHSDENIKPIVLRAYQQMRKIMLIDAVSSAEIGNPAPIISKGNIEFARNYIEASIKNTKAFFDESLIQSKFHRDSQKVIRVLKNHPSGLTQRELTRKLVSQFKSSELYDKKNGIVSNLIEAGRIQAFQEKKQGPGKPKIKFVFIRDQS